MPGRIITVPDDNVRYLIEQAWEAGEPNQWLREGVFNALEAGSSWIEVGFEKQFLTKHGIQKRYIADNGMGMNEGDLITFMSSFGGGGKPIAKGENFGQGFKSSSLPWNPYGLVVCSWTGETPEGRMIWLYQDADKNYALKEFELVDEDGEIDVQEVIIPQWNEELGIDFAQLRSDEITEAGHGSVFLFLGDSFVRSTADGDYIRGDITSKRGLVAYLNQRFLDLPKDVEMSVVGLEAYSKTERRESKDSTVTIPETTDDGSFVLDKITKKQVFQKKTWHPRRVRGVENFIKGLVKEDKDTTPSPATGEVVVDSHGTKIRWFLQAESGVKGDGSYGPSKPLIGIEYSVVRNGEKLRELYHSTSGVRDYRNFAISSAPVANRLWLIVQPPILTEGSTKWGVYPQASRARLYGKGGTELPIDDWANAFWKNMPAEIKDAINAEQSGAIVSTGDVQSGRVKELISRLSMRMRPKRLVASLKGTETGTPGAGSTGTPRTGAGKPKGPKDPDKVPGTKNPSPVPNGGMGETQLLTPDPAGAQMGIIRHRGDGIPATRWYAGTEWTDQTGQAPTVAVFFDPKASEKLEDGTMSAGVIYINRDFQMFSDEFVYWMNQYPKASSDEVIQLVQAKYQEQLVAVVCHANKLRGQPNGVGGRFGEKDVENLLSSTSLTTAVLGLINVESNIRTAAGGKFGKATAA